MSRKTLSIFILFFSALFVFQTFDISFARSNPKTCCGRVICLCKHGAGMPCPIKNKIKIQETHAQDHVMPCHRKSKPAPVVKKEIPAGTVSFSAAPCAKNTPKTLMPQIFKDYLSSGGPQIAAPIKETGFAPDIVTFPPLSFSSSIEHPPRTF